jgi:hypothetical protein
MGGRFCSGGGCQDHMARLFTRILLECACILTKGTSNSGMLQEKKGGRKLGRMAGFAGLGMLHLWCLAALYYWFSSHAALAWGMVAGYLGLIWGIFKVAQTPRHGAVASLILFAGTVIWWSGRRAEKGLVYPLETEQATRITVDGSMITVSGIRDFHYRSESDFDVRWSTRTFDTAQLEGVDLFFNYWGVPQVAHLITSFVFKDQPPLAVSIELRSERDEPRTLLRGFFKQYELHYVWADERDVIQLRSAHRKEEMYLYRTSLTPFQGSRLLQEMALRSNELEEEPEFYNTLTENCTNVMARHVEQVTGRQQPWYLRPLLTGKYERLGYERGWLVHTLPFEAHRAAAAIQARALQAGDNADFSTRIRSHLPVPVAEQYPSQ